MSDESLNLLLTAGQIGALVFALLAAFAGGIWDWQERSFRKPTPNLRNCTRRSARLLAANGILLRARKSAKNSNSMNNKINSWGKAPRIQVMYENAFGKDLAGSIALAFEAAKWDVMLGPGSGFENGIKVGPGQVGQQLKDIIIGITGVKDVAALRPQEQDSDLHFIGIGAKRNTISFIPENGSGAGVRMKKGKFELELWLSGPRILNGLARPGISLGREHFRRAALRSAPSSSRCQRDMSLRVRSH